MLDSLRIALNALTTHKLRSALTVLGIVIGISAVISLMSVGQGAQQQVVSNIQAMGSNLLFIRPGAPVQGGVRGALGTAATLTVEDAEALGEVPGVAMAAPEAFSFAQAISPAGNMGVRVIATSPEYLAIRNLSLREGEFLNPQNLQARSMVVVLGANVADSLFPEVSPVGQSLRLGRRSFRVIGVLQSQGGTFLGFLDDMVVLPITTAQDRLQAQRAQGGRQRIQTIYVQLIDMKEREQATESITALLRQRHRLDGGDDFNITSQEDMIQALQQITGIFTIVLGSIAGISLLVGGIGVMNIMLVSVAERTREIGIRKAVGARRRDIRLQFLLEAVLLSLVGGGLGVAAGYGLSRLLSGLSLGGQSIVTVVSPNIVFLALGVSAAVGVFFGVYPASRAAALPPVEALRHE